MQMILMVLMLTCRLLKINQKGEHTMKKVFAAIIGTIVLFVGGGMQRQYY